MAKGDIKDTHQVMMELAAEIVDRYGKIGTVLNRFETDTTYFARDAIRDITKIVRGETI